MHGQKNIKSEWSCEAKGRTLPRISPGVHKHRAPDRHGD